ncbi:MAG TPA: hypothetical protein VFN48_11790 [Solirubrobacteraceae bacterium]|nr:hypothetical protein [Solirubrobacteraceae bacterium]
MTDEPKIGTARAGEPPSAAASERPTVVESPPAGGDPRGEDVSRPALPRRPGADWGHRIEGGLRWSGARLVQPRPRTIAVGVVLILVGTLVASNSFWTFPLILVGVLMIVVAWVGGRLQGRFAIEWGEEGAGIELNARLRAPAPVPARLTPGSAPPTPGPPGTTATTAVSDPPETTASTAVLHPPSVVGPVETIDGEAHTMELDARELRALVAAIEAQAAALEGSARASDAAAPVTNHRSPSGDPPPAV